MAGDLIRQQGIGAVYRGLGATLARSDINMHSDLHTDTFHGAFFIACFTSVLDFVFYNHYDGFLNVDSICTWTLQLLSFLSLKKYFWSILISSAIDS